MTNSVIKITKRRDQDPTLTLPIRKRWLRETDSRFNSLIKKINQYIKSENRLINPQQQASPISLQDFTQYDNQLSAHDQFMDWYDIQVQEDILEGSKSLNSDGMFLWSDVYLDQAYIQGKEQSGKDSVTAGIITLLLLSQLNLTRQQIHIDARQMLFSQNFDSMKGVTDAMRSQISRVLSDGMRQGLSQNQIAANIVDRVRKVGLTRARLIARTETSFAYNFAALNQYRVIGNATGQAVYVQWWTALDERVRQQHRTWHAKIYTIERAMTMIGAPNCRCATLPISKNRMDELGFKLAA